MDSQTRTPSHVEVSPSSEGKKQCFLITKGVKVWPSPRVGQEQGLGCWQVAEGSPSYLLVGETLGTCFLRATRCVTGPLALRDNQVVLHTPSGCN